MMTNWIILGDDAFNKGNLACGLIELSGEQQDNWQEIVLSKLSIVAKSKKVRKLAKGTIEFSNWQLILDFFHRKGRKRKRCILIKVSFGKKYKVDKNALYHFMKEAIDIFNDVKHAHFVYDNKYWKRKGAWFDIDFYDYDPLYRRHYLERKRDSNNQGPSELFI